MTDHPSPSELLGEHLKYEIDMLRGTLIRLPTSADQVIANALMESYYTHARGLIEFLQGKKKRTARDYVGSSPPYKPFKGKEGRVGDLNQKINEQISHLRFGRTADNSKKLGDAERAELYELLRDAVTHFKTCLRPEYHAIDIGELPPLSRRVPSTTSPTIVTPVRLD